MTSSSSAPNTARRSPWSNSDTEEYISRDADVQPDEWVRLVPFDGPEVAKLDVMPVKLDASGRPTPRAPVIDRKIAPLYDLMDANSAPEVLCSERFVRALSDIGVTGWSATLVPHATPNRVWGHRVYKLSCEGWTGPVVDTALKGEPDAAARALRTPEGAIAGDPIPPVSFDASLWTGHDLSWSPWFGRPPLLWRALITSGAVWRALCERIPGLVMVGSERVNMLGAGERRPFPPGHCAGPDEDPPPPPPEVSESIARIEREATAYNHKLPPGASEAEVRAAFSSLGGEPPDEILAILRRWNGASLYDGALLFYAMAGDGDIEEMNRVASGPEYPPHEGMVAFAETRDGVIVWAMNKADGLVHGLGREGILYGPAAPFAAWLADQLSDMTYAWDNAKQIQWAYRMLWQ